MLRLDVVAGQGRQLDAAEGAVDVVARRRVLGLLANSGGRGDGTRGSGRRDGSRGGQGSGGEGDGLGRGQGLVRGDGSDLAGGGHVGARHCHGRRSQLWLERGLDRGPRLGAAVLVAPGRGAAEVLDLAAPLGEADAVQGVRDAGLHVAAGDVDHAVRPGVRAALAVLPLGQGVAELAAAEIALGGRDNDRRAHSGGGGDAGGAGLECGWWHSDGRGGSRGRDSLGG